jgi:hypothetical protein
MQYQNNQTCCGDNSYQNGSCYTGCGQTMPIVPGSNTALYYWNGQDFVIADGSVTSPIFLPNIQTFNSAPNYLLGTTNNGLIAFYPYPQYVGSNGSVNAIVRLTQAEYNALTPPNPTTLYIIIG